MSTSRIILLLAALAVIGGGLYIYGNMPSTQAVLAGDTAPDFQLEDTQGNRVSLAALRGKIVMVNFWATWCPPCIEEMPSMERLYEAMGDDENFVMLAINTEKDGRSAVAEFLKKTPYTFPILYDDKGVTQESYGVYKFPETFIIGKNGMVIEKIIGPLDWSSPKTINRLKALTRG